MEGSSKKMSKKLTKIIESVTNNHQDRNKSARDRLSKKYSEIKTKTAESSLTTTTTTQSTPPPQQSTLWTDKEIQKTIERMDPQQRYMYSQMGKELFKSGGLMDSIVVERKDPQSLIFESAEQIRLMLRDGLSVSDLTQDEIRTLVSALGPDEVESTYGIDLKLSSPTENEQPDRACYSVSLNTGEN
jgi:hypothetical protein